jgi:hypothetical protein
MERTESRISDDDPAIPFIGTQNPKKAPRRSSPRKYADGQGSGAGWSSRRGGTKSSESDRPLSEALQISERLEDLARPLVRIHDRQPPGTVQAKPPLPSLDCPTGRAYLETGLLVSELLGPDQKQGRLRAKARPSLPARLPGATVFPRAKPHQRGRGRGGPPCRLDAEPH